MTEKIQLPECVYTRTITETVTGVFVTAENIYDLAAAISASTDAFGVSVQFRDNKPCVKGNSRRGAGGAFGIGSIIKVSDTGAVQDAYPGRILSDWEEVPRG